MKFEAKSIEDKSDCERICVLYKHAKVTLISVVIIAVVTSTILWDSVSHTLLLVWVGLIFLLSFVRAFSVYQFFKQPVLDIKKLKQWKSYFVAGALLSGLLWSVLAWFMIDFSSVFNTLVIILTLVTMSAGALGAHAAYPPAYYAFLFPVVFSLVTRLVFEGDEYIYSAVLIIIFLLAFVSYTKTHYQLLTESIKQRYFNADLITDLELKKAEAEQANADKTRFLSSASHDLRQPIHAMGLFSESLSAELTTVKQHALIGKLEDSMGAMDSLLSSLLDMSKLDAGLVQADITTVNVMEVLRKLIQEMNPQAVQKGLIIKIKNQHEEYFVLTDTVLLESILRNLLSNAIKYTEHGQISLNCHIQGNTCELVLADTGLGIAEVEHDDIFQAFYQVGNPERDRSQGIGLGLSIVKRLCILLEIPMTLQSQLGKGTTFTLRLPRTSEINVKKEAPVLPTQLSLSVLVLDDDIVILDAMQLMLEAWGCTVIIAESVEDLAALLQDKPKVDFMIADYRLQGETTGTDAILLARALLEQPDLPCVIVSGDTESSRLLEVKKAGFMMLHKPLRPAQIRSLLQRL